MERIEKLRKCGMIIFCRLVKGAGLVLLGLVLVIAIGEGPPNPFKLSLRELALMVSLLVILGGTVCAMWRQGVGGVVMTGGWIVFSIVNGRLPKGWFFNMFLLVGILNIVCWWLGTPRKVVD